MTRQKNLRKTPLYHITASWGWMNDPCGPGYDPSTDTYHIFYQWNPKGCEWGNMSWGHLTSKDMVTWRRTGPQPAVAPDQPYDKHGIFTGCFHPSGVRTAKQGLTLFYSSICKLPFSWETLPYPRNAAGISAATSEDGGVSWTKISENPILAGEPEGTEVTGFRDPYIATWESMDNAQKSKGSLYAIVGGGIRDQGPAVFLYKVDPANTLEWKYIGTLLQTPTAFRPSRKWSGDAGVNWECPGFFTVGSKEASRDFVIFGSEGGEERDHIPPPSSTSADLPQRVRRWCMWMSGPIKNDAQSSPFMDYQFGGILDHGCFYAASSFHDPKHNRRVVWGWVIEDDITIEQCRAKGWTGCLAIPRELFLVELHHVTRARRSQLEDISCIELDKRDETSYTVRTLGIRPLAQLSSLRGASPQVLNTRSNLSGVTGPVSVFRTDSSHWELIIELEVGQNCSTTGVRVVHGKSSTHTEIIFSPVKEEVIIRRPEQQGGRSDNESASWLLNNREERGPHTLFTFGVVSDQGMKETQEKLRLHIFRDGQVLEVFANERFALATMIYVDDSTTGVEDIIQGFAETVNGDTGGAILERAEFWELNQAVIPEDFERASGDQRRLSSSL